MAAPYIPPQDAGLDTWATNFATLITASPATYGLTPTDAAAIQSARDTYHAAYLLGGLTAPPHPVPVNPSTRTPITVAAKDAAKLASRALWRTYAAQIRLNPGVSNSDKLALGLNLPNNSPTPIPAPITWPLMSFVSAGPLTQVWTYVDSMAGVGKAKPPGAVQLQLFASAGTAPVVDPTLLSLFSVETKSPLQIDLPPADAGKLLSVSGRWVTRRGLTGPYGPIQTAYVVGA
jgi:hypothetical protein